VANFYLNRPKRHPQANRPLMDYDLILVMQVLNGFVRSSCDLLQRVVCSCVEVHTLVWCDLGVPWVFLFRVGDLSFFPLYLSCCLLLPLSYYTLFESFL